MNHSQFDTPQSATGTAAATTLHDRDKQLSQLIINNYGEITEAAYTAHPQLLVFDAQHIVKHLVRKLDRYTGPTTQEAFLGWAKRFAAREASRYQITEDILDSQKSVIHKAIHSTLHTSAENTLSNHADIYAEVAALIFQRAHSLNTRGRARLSTRITALVKTHVRGYHNSYNNRRFKATQRWVADGLQFGCEQFSGEELAQMRNRDEPVYDPGYQECGLSVS